jgi:hypothetical protein
MLNRSQYIETTEIYPREKSETEVNFVLPKKQGYLSADTRLIIPATCITAGYQYPPNVGVFSLFQTVTIMTESGGIIDQLNNANELYSTMGCLRTPEQRKRVDSVLYGINYSFEGGSGSKMDQTLQREVLAGQHRIVTQNYENFDPVVQGRNNAVPNCINAVPKLLLTTDINTTPEYSISLNEMFPGLFIDGNYQLPLGLIDEEIMIQLIFSKNSGLGDNDRAIFCPSLEDKARASTIISLGVLSNGAGNVAAKNLILTDSNNNVTHKCKIMVDVATGTLKPENIRILDGGAGYNNSSTLVFNNSGWTRTLKCTPSCNLTTTVAVDDNMSHFLIVSGGAGFDPDDKYYIYNPTNNNLKIEVEAVNTDGAGVLTELELADSQPNMNTAFPYGTYIEYNIYDADGNDTGARVVVAQRVLKVTSTAVGDVISQYARIRNTNSSDTATKFGRYYTADGNKYIYDLYGNIEAGDVIDYYNADDAVDNGNLTINSVISTFNILNVYGLGFDPIYSFDHVREPDVGKINIDLTKIYMSTDIIYYLNGKLEEDKKRAMTTGITNIYSRFIDVSTTIADQNTVTDYGNANNVYTSRLIGMSNELIRNIYFGLSPSGNHNNNKFPYYNSNDPIPKVNPLLNKYCSISPLKQAGLEFQIIVNSTPVYNQAIQTDSRAYTEFSKCFGDFNVPKCLYSSWEAARQLDNPDVVNSNNPSKQSGMTTLDGWDNAIGGYVPTKQYEVNERKMGVANQLYLGIPQKYNLGMNHYVGTSFKFMDEPNTILPMNGIVSRNTPIEIRYTHANTYNPYYSTPCRMSLFTEVQRSMTIKNGLISVTNALY